MVFVVAIGGVGIYGVCLFTLVGGVCGGGCWCVGIRGVCNLFFKIYVYINCNVIFCFSLFVGKTYLLKEKKAKVDQRLTTQKKAIVQKDSEELPEQSQSRKSETEERCENNVEGGGQGSVDGDE